MDNTSCYSAAKGLSGHVDMPGGRGCDMHREEPRAHLREDPLPL